MNTMIRSIIYVKPKANTLKTGEYFNSTVYIFPPTSSNPNIARQAAPTPTPKHIALEPSNMKYKYFTLTLSFARAKPISIMVNRFAIKLKSFLK